MTKKEKVAEFIRIMKKERPEAETELHYSNNFELLTAVILSAQCTDVRVNLVTPALFKAFPTPEVMAAASFDELFPYIRSISYPNNKTKHLIGMAQKLLSDFDGEVPGDVDELQTLPGVGRKTANVIASVVYNKPAFAVDTHVFRVAARIGFTTNAKTPRQTEDQLMKLFPSDIIPKAHHWLILHGRYICKARVPLCNKCPLTHICSYYKSL